MEIMALAVVSARMFGVLIGLPISDALQFVPRLCIALVFGATMVTERCSFAGFLPLVCVSEFLIGFLIAVPTRCFVEVAASLGELIDVSRGAMQGAILDPLNGALNSDLASIFRIGATVMALYFGALEASFVLVRESFEIVKPGTFGFAGELGGTQLNRSFALMELVLGLGGCWMIAFLMVDLFVAILAKFSFGLSFVAVAGIMKLIVTALLLFWVLGTNVGARETLARTLWAGIGV